MNSLLQILPGQSGTVLEVSYWEKNLAGGGVSEGNLEGSEFKHFAFAHMLGFKPQLLPLGKEEAVFNICKSRREDCE